MEELNFYTLLEIEKSASQDQIKKAYRKMSFQWHPDRNKSPEATQKFQEIATAYSVLSDPSKRAQYDGQQCESLNLPDLFKVFMGSQHGPGPGNMPNFGFGFPGGMPVNEMSTIFQNLGKPAPIINTISITLQEAFTGVSYPLKINRWIAAKDSKQFEDETIYIKIPQGVDEGEIIITRGKGNILYPENRGDIKTFIKIDNDTAFKRHGLDLDYTHLISLKQALCGFSFEINHINGTRYQINNSSGTIIHPSYKKTIPKKGMVRDGMVGNLNIHFIIEFPKSLPENDLLRIAEILQ
jgi:DnaJ-class molecular chaperone